MRKIKGLLVSILAVALILGAVGCKKADAGTDAPFQGGNVSGGTIGEIVTADFKKTLAEHPDWSSQEIAEKLCENQALTINPVTMAVEEGYLTGFNNGEIKGFREGTLFAPMIGSIPFVGYVFVLDDNQDVGVFMNMLKENADLRWNVCTSADEMVVTNVKQVVLFVMCPKEFEE